MDLAASMMGWPPVADVIQRVAQGESVVLPDTLHRNMPGVAGPLYERKLLDEAKANNVSLLMYYDHRDMGIRVAPQKR